MTSMLVFIVLALLAAAFILWPLLSRRRFTPVSDDLLNEQLQANVQLFHEHIAELEAALAAGRIDAAQFAQLKLEQERNLLDDEANLEARFRNPLSTFGAIFLASAGIVCVIAALVLYQRWGSAPDVAIHQLQQQKNQLDYQDMLQNRQPDPQRALEFMAAVEARLEQKPESTQYWFVLARSAMEVGDYARAVNAYERILPLDPEASIVKGELAQAMFLRDKNRISPAIVHLAESALLLDAQNTTALGLLGINAFEQKNFTAAVEYWQRAVAILGPEAPGSQALQGGIARAQSEAKKAGETIDQPEAAAGRSISVQVKLGEELDLSGDLPVFIYARAWQGARIPLAIQRLTLAELPTQVTLDETMAMSPAMSLAQADQVEVVARIALDGSATAKAGDWQGSVGPIDLDNLPAEIVISIDQQLSE